MTTKLGGSEGSSNPQLRTLPRAHSLESHRALDVAPQIHDLSPDGRNERMCSVLFGEVVARDGECDIRSLGRFGDTKHGTGEEHPVWLGRGQSLELARGGGVDLSEASGVLA